jgi:hypothetical protein
LLKKSFKKEKLIPQLAIDFDKLTHDSQKLYEEVKKLSLTEA